MAAVAAGLIGFLIDGFPLPLWPGVHLVFGSAITLVVAVRYGPVAGALASLLAGSRTWWLWDQPFPSSALLLGLEGAWVGAFSRRRPDWRPLYLTLSYWILLGSGLNLLAQHLLFGLPWTMSAALGLRSIMNGFFCALLAEVLLMVVADVERRRGGRPFRLSLSAVIGLVLMLGISLPAAVAVVGFSRRTRDQLIEEAQIGTVKRSGTLRHAMSARLNTFGRAVALTAGVIEGEGIALKETERLTVLLENARRANPELAGMYVADARAVTVAFSPRRDAQGHSLVGRDYSDRRYYQELLQRRRTVISGVYQARGGMTTPTAAIAVPLFEADGRLRGFVLGWFHLEAFHETATSVAGSSPGDQAVITDAEGLLVADSSRRPQDYLRVESVAGSPMFAATHLDTTGSRILESEPSGGHPRTAAAATLHERSWIAWATVPESGWRVVVRSSMSAVDGKIAVLYMRTALGLGVLVVAAAVLAQFIGRRIARPLMVLDSNAQRLAAGDLSACPEGSYILTREVQSLNDSFVEMVGRLNQSWAEQRGLTGRAEKTAREAQEYARRIGALHELGRDLASSFDLAQLSRASRDYLKSQLGATTFVLSLYHAAVDRLLPFFYWTAEDGEDDHPGVSPMREGAEERCRRDRVPVLLAPSALCLPLMVQDRLVGSLYVETPPGSISLSDLKRLQPAATQIAMSVSNARLFEQVLRAKAEWEATFDQMSDGVFLFDERRRLARVNRAGAAMEGASPQAMIGRACCEVATGSDEDHCMVADVVATGRAVSREVLTGGRPYYVTIEAVRGTGRITGALCVIRDLSDLRRAQEETREQRQLNSQLLEFAREVVCTVDRDGRSAWFNRRLCEATGYSSAELEEVSLLKFVHPDDRALVRRRFQASLAGQLDSAEARFIRRDGEVRWFTASYAPIKDSGQIMGVLAVMRDVTEERQATERMHQANKLAAVGQLAAGVAHDFNNILTAILGRAQLVRRRLHDPELEAGMEVIEKAALDGAATVRRLQTFAEHRTEHDLEPVRLDELAEDVLALMRTRWRDDALARGIHYELELDLRAPCPVLGSSSELREVLTNLVINALDAMPEGGRLSLRSSVDDGRVKLRVADSGLGMTPEVQQRIFEPFYTTKGPSGMGLGLAVSYGIVQRHRGTIEVESAPGRGTVFTLALPVTTREPKAASPHAQEPTGSVRALVIDDEDAVRSTLADVLTALGHQVVSVPSGKEGLQRLESAAFDVVFTDLSMPGMDGWSVARSVRGLRPATKVFLVTGYGATVELTDETSAFVDGVISKPFAIDQIDSVLRHLAVA